MSAPIAIAIVTTQLSLSLGPDGLSGLALPGWLHVLAHRIKLLAHLNGENRTIMRLIYAKYTHPSRAQMEML
jgi:hypothetical protein